MMKVVRPEAVEPDAALARWKRKPRLVPRVFGRCDSAAGMDCGSHLLENMAR